MNIKITNAFGTRRIARHFKARELACPCCGECEVDAKLLQLLEDIRHASKDKPLHINSGYRCLKHNQEVNGARNSQHRFGKAADIWSEGATPDELYDMACVLMPNYGGIIKHKNYIHVDVRNTMYRKDAEK